MKLYEIVFSPTGGTKKAADILGERLAALGGLSDMERETVDLTDWDADFSAVSLSPEDIALLAVPSYGGLVPKPALERLEKIRGNGARAVLVCVYGNRAFEDTLTELFDAAKVRDFRQLPLWPPLRSTPLPGHTPVPPGVPTLRTGCS